MHFDYDTTKVDDAVLALLWLTSFREKKDWPLRAWKGHDWDALNRLNEGGYISDPRGRARSVMLTEEGAKRAEQLFEAMFGKGAA